MDTLTEVKTSLYGLVGRAKSLQAAKELLLKAGSCWLQGEEWFKQQAQIVLEDYRTHLLPQQIPIFEELVIALIADMQERSSASHEYRLLAHRIGTKILSPEDLDAHMRDLVTA